MVYIKLTEKRKAINYLCLHCKTKYISKIKREKCPECNNLYRKKLDRKMTEEKTISIKEQYDKDKSKIDSNDSRQIKQMLELEREHQTTIFD